jgi:hypothetical protein
MKILDFSKELIKGKIAEIIFEQMFRESGEFIIQRFGYEYITPELAQYQHLLDKHKEVLADVRHTPDFILIAPKQGNVFMLETKYRAKLNDAEIKQISEDLVRRWHSPWLFVASLSGFYFQPCHLIIENSGNISPLSENWVPFPVQKGYLELLQKFEIGNK